ncbi:glycosyltransferase [Roseivirga spongicola]|uniref:Glycosyltransferase subfamily 4-like N-terminal domain-containing protein n=1 Tax=Roseivirga spongicola TaxID=333140 RepID=A0A150XHQ2_9BACT|nr:glycosyltransferase [Roseivirga spongicola]KYG78195.1 hypothetical protein AWW68_05360 [Roseivirga spongicola]WPZ11940.1 glycosyltransferase [Roseivirga spongicola]
MKRKIYIIDLAERSPAYNKELHKALKENGSSAEYVDSTFKSNMWGYVKYFPQKKGLLFKHFKFINLLLNHLFFYRSILKSKHLTTLHFQWLPLFDKTSLELFILKRLKKRGHKLVLTIHNVLPHDSNLTFKSRFKKLYNVMDKIIVHSENIRCELINDYSIAESNIEVVRHGSLLFNPEEYSEENNEFSYALFFGLIRPYKGVDFLLSAWKEVNRVNPNLRLKIIGKCPDSYEEVVLSHIHDDMNVEYKNIYADVSELKKYIKGASLLIFPYRAITTSGAVITGLSAGKAAILTDLPTFKSEFSESCEFVQYGNSSELSTAILGVSQDSEKRKVMISNSLELMKEKYNWSGISLDTMEIYKSLNNG